MNAEQLAAEVTTCRHLLQQLDVALAHLEGETEDADEIECLQSARDHISDAIDSLLHMPFGA